MKKQDCLLQLGEAAREINGYRNQLEVLKARDAQLKNLVEDFERSAKSCEIERVRLGYNISGACMAGRVGAYGECARKLKALLLV